MDRETAAKAFPFDQFEGARLYTLRHGSYEAIVYPGQGGHLISLRYEGLPLLHEPESLADLKTPTSYGLPILFPPNRIDGGHFVCAGREYQFPVNEKARGNSLHGFLHTRPWQVTSHQGHEIQMRFVGSSEADFFSYFPVKFTVTLTYRLTEHGLYQQVKVQNDDDFPMPLGLGFHSAFTVRSGMKVLMSVSERIELNERMLPSGTVRALSPQEKLLREGGLDPMAWAMDDHYSGEPILVDGAPFYGMVLREESGSTYYEVDRFYRHFMMWNQNQNGAFVCLEPQNWRVNAPNLVESLGARSGFDVLAPGEKVEVDAHIYRKNEQES